jgi:hypothetical protein
MSWTIRIVTFATLALATVFSGAASASDVARLKALHQKVIRAHEENSVDLLLADESADYVVASRGEVSRPTMAERRKRFASYLERTDFQEYRDVADPLVTVSDDGTLGWVIAQVHMRGDQMLADNEKRAIEFTSAWIELYQKRDGRWYRIGNVSNFKQ